MSHEGYFLAGLEFVCSAAMLAVSIAGGFPPFLFLSGLAAGAGLVMLAMTFERRLHEREKMLDRLHG